jgi:hypothetical protein
MKSFRLKQRMPACIFKRDHATHNAIYRVVSSFTSHICAPLGSQAPYFTPARRHHNKHLFDIGQKQLLPPTGKLFFKQIC